METNSDSKFKFKIHSTIQIQYSLFKFAALFKILATIQIRNMNSARATTGDGLFAECLLHSAKPLLSATLGKEPPSNPLSIKAALPSAKFRALGKGFAAKI